ncbi:hypothetical protein G9F73_014020 [Clostridium estertheticum]|uniref:hypothetical protein n=1 Tax=Clostridium estertheticum TaxID=238834 RepID=UPI0013EE91C0|nr:hypothetical protein [Clostridium estertheticum]MBZ9608917.1 hypothetical protein [Clostridium estertheticum]
MDNTTLNNVNVAGTVTSRAGSRIPDICLKNAYVAVAISVIIDGVLIAAGVGSVSLFVKKVGKAEAKKYLREQLQVS